MALHTINWSQMKHLRFLSWLSNDSVNKLKDQVYKTLRDREKDALFW
jgi:hypothetical protein